MAIITSPIASTITGSIGDITYQRNRYHQIVARARPHPANPPSTRRTHYLTARTWAAQQWAALSPAQRSGWADYAATLTIDRNNIKHIPNAFNTFMACLTFRHFYKLESSDSYPEILDPPTTPGYLAIHFIGPLPYPGHNGFIVKVYNPNSVAVLRLRRRTTLLPTTINRWYGRYHWDSTFTYIAAHGVGWIQDTLTPDKVMFITLRFCAATTPHCLSPELKIRCPVFPA